MKSLVQIDLPALGVAMMTLNRPQARNALSCAMMTALVHCDFQF